MSSAGALPNDDIPDVIMALLLLAMEPSTSADLKRDILLTINAICLSITGDSDAASTIVSSWSNGL